MNGEKEPDYAIDVEGLYVSFDGRPALADVTWRVPRGTAAAIIGPNGGGKSTLLRTLVGSVRPDRGTVRILGKPAPHRGGAVSYVPQYEEIEWRFPLTVLDVVLQGRLSHYAWWQRPKAEDRDRALAAIRRVGLEAQARRPIGDLSGGQRQRALIARALAQDAQVILLDEPATGLDATAQHDLLDLLRSLQQGGKTVVTTTHDLDCITECFDSVLCLRGRVICQGPPRETLTAERLAAVFGRHMPLLHPSGEVTMVEHH